MNTNAIRMLKEEKGFVLVVAVLMLAIVTVIGIAATQTADTEMQIAANERSRIDNFYDAEGGLIDVSERSTTWLTDSFLTAGEDLAAYTGNIDFNGDGTNDSLIEIRCVKSGTASVAGLSDTANDLPLGSHINPPPAGSGYSVKYFEVRRYGVTSTSTSGDTRLQLGVWKLFNKF